MERPSLLVSSITSPPELGDKQIFREVKDGIAIITALVIVVVDWVYRTVEGMFALSLEVQM